MYHRKEWQAKNARHRKQVGFNLLVIPIVLAHVKTVFLWLTRGTPLKANLELTVLLMLLGAYAYVVVKLRDSTQRILYWHERARSIFAPGKDPDVESMIERDMNFMDRMVK